MNRAVKWLLLLALVSMIAGISGCSTEPPNASVRPWSTPQSWEGGLPVDMGQHD
jgi:hypothetical protein